MAVNEAKTAAGFQVGVELFERGVFDLDFCAALSANEVMMVLLGNLIDQTPTAHVGGMRQSILCQELERAIDGWFGQAGQVAFGALVYLRGREVTAGVMKHMQDGKTLGRHAKAARAQLGSVLVAAGHNSSLSYFQALQAPEDTNKANHRSSLRILL